MLSFGPWEYKPYAYIKRNASFCALGPRRVHICVRRRCGGPITHRSEVRMSAIACPLVGGRVAQSIRALWRDTDGVILPYVTLMLVVIIGVSVLALDGSRYMSLQTQLQNGADALALAGAAELDRTPTAIERANRAIGFRCEANRSTCQPIAGGHGLVSNWSFFGSGPDRNIRVAGITNSCARCRCTTATPSCREMSRAIRRRLHSSR